MSLRKFLRPLKSSLRSLLETEDQQNGHRTLKAQKTGLSVEKYCVGFKVVQFRQTRCFLQEEYKECSIIASIGSL